MYMSHVYTCVKVPKSFFDTIDLLYFDQPNVINELRKQEDNVLNIDQILLDQRSAYIYNIKTKNEYGPKARRFNLRTT